MPTPKDCGDQVHIDIFEVEDLTETRFYAVHIIDAVSRFQMGEILTDKSADSAVQFVKRRWMPIFGPPHVLVASPCCGIQQFKARGRVESVRRAAAF